MKKIKTIYKNDGFMVDTPAAISREDAILYINMKLFGPLTPFERKFVLLHEYGHYNLNTSNEIAADAYAFDRLVGTQAYSINQMGCLLQDKILDINKPGHAARIAALHLRAKIWLATHPDATKNDIRIIKQMADYTQSMYDSFSLMTQTYQQGSQNTNNAMILGILGLAVVMMLVLTKD